MKTLIGKKVRYYRRLYNLTMEELGALIETGHSYISQVEGGKLMPGSDVLAKLADALHVPADALLGREANPDDTLEKTAALVADLRMERPFDFITALHSLPETDQIVLARFVRLAAVDYKMKAPRSIRAARGTGKSEAK